MRGRNAHKTFLLAVVPLLLIILLAGCGGSTSLVATPSTSTARIAPTATNPSTGGGDPTGYLAEDYSEGRTLVFIQWTEASGNLSGQMLTIQINQAGAARPLSTALTGQRNRANVTLRFLDVSIFAPPWARTSSYTVSGTIGGDTLTLLLSNSQTGTFTPFSLRAATVQDYNNAVQALHQEAAATSTAMQNRLVGKWEFMGGPDFDMETCGCSATAFEFLPNGKFSFDTAGVASHPGTYIVSGNTVTMNYQWQGQNTVKAEFYVSKDILTLTEQKGDEETGRFRRVRPPSTATPGPASALPKAASQGPVTVTVSAEVVWQDTGLAVQPGQRVTIAYQSGTWSIWGGVDPYTDGIGQPRRDEKCRLVPGANLGGLVGQVGEGVPFFVGNGTTITSGAGGNLKLSINDCPDKRVQFDLNRGALTVTVTIE